MNITPIDDRVVVRPNESESKTAAGLYLPEGAKEKPVMGKVIAVGPGKANKDGKRTAVSVKKGDQVVYGKYAGNEVEIKGDKHVIMRESELLGLVEN